MLSLEYSRVNLTKSIFLKHQPPLPVKSDILNLQNPAGQTSEIIMWNFVSWAAYLRWARLVRLWGSWTVAASAGSFKGPLCLLLPRIVGEGWMGLLSGCDRMFLGCQGPLVSKLKVSTAAYDAPPAVPLITLLPGTPPRGGFILKRLVYCGKPRDKL